MNHKQAYLESVKQGILAQGKKELLNYLDAQRLTQAEVIKAYCYDCMGFYIDGKG
jgi:hypothetical protein